MFLYIFINYIYIGPFIFSFFILSISPCDPELSHINYLKKDNNNFNQFPKPISYTRTCDDLYPKNDLTVCEDESINVDISSFSVIPQNRNVQIQVKLNISINIYVSVVQAFMRLECLNAYDLNDDYCHNHTKQISEWGRMIWPCRSVQFLNSSNDFSNLILPINFGYKCFPIFSLSTYKLSFALLPQKCLMEYIVTIPEYSQLKPEIFYFYKPNGTIKWSPLLYVSLNSNDGVWIRYESYPTFVHTKVSIFIYILSDNNTLEEIHSRDIYSSSIINGFKYQNLKRGNYTIYAFSVNQNCETHCDNGSVGQNCTICPFTILQFENPEDKFSTLELLKIKGSIGITWLLSILLIVSFIIVMYITISLLYQKFFSKYIRNENCNEIENVQLLDVPEVIIIYINDSNEHKNVVVAFADYLEEYGNCKIRIIDWELYDANAINPVISFQSKYFNSIRLFILSETTDKILSDNNLRNKDFVFFKTLLEMAIYEYSNTDYENWSKKYIFARFTYLNVDHIPPLISSISKKIYNIPLEIGEIVAKIHKYELSEHRVIIDQNSPKYNTLKDTIDYFIQTRFKILKSDKINLSNNSLNNNMNDIKIDEIPIRNKKEVIPGKYDEYGVVDVVSLCGDSDEDSKVKLVDGKPQENMSTSRFQVIGSPDDEETDSSFSE